MAESFVIVAKRKPTSVILSRGSSAWHCTLTGSPTRTDGAVSDCRRAPEFGQLRGVIERHLAPILVWILIACLLITPLSIFAALACYALGMISLIHAKLYVFSREVAMSTDRILSRLAHFRPLCRPARGTC